MFDHITIRVEYFGETVSALTAALGALDLAPVSSTAAFAVWPPFAVGPVDDQHEPTRWAHLAFVAPSAEAVDRFWQAAIAAGLTDAGEPGTRPDPAGHRYAAVVRDLEGNTLEAVYDAEPGPEPPIEHVAVGVADLDAAVAFYAAIGDTAGLKLAQRGPNRATFTTTTTGGATLVLAGGTPTEHLHLAFTGRDADVERFHATAVAAGYRSNGDPGERPQYHAGFYAAYVLDPDGNNVEVVDHHRR